MAFGWAYVDCTGSGGGGGSGGTAGQDISGGSNVPGVYGGGAARQGQGGVGALRLIYPGNTRLFPSTGTGDQ